MGSSTPLLQRVSHPEEVASDLNDSDPSPGVPNWDSLVRVMKNLWLAGPHLLDPSTGNQKGRDLKTFSELS